jgi:hypothetical protein
MKKNGVLIFHRRRRLTRLAALQVISAVGSSAAEDWGAYSLDFRPLAGSAR